MVNMTMVQSSSWKKILGMEGGREKGREAEHDVR